MLKRKPYKNVEYELVPTKYYLFQRIYEDVIWTKLKKNAS